MRKQSSAETREKIRRKSISKGGPVLKSGTIGNKKSSLELNEALGKTSPQAVLKKPLGEKQDLYYKQEKKERINNKSSQPSKKEEKIVVVTNELFDGGTF